MSTSARLSVVICALAGLVAPNPAQAQISDAYILTIKYQSGQHQECERMNGRAEAVVENWVVKSSLVRSLRLSAEPNGAVSGFGYESITGHGAAIHLIGKQTPRGFEGTAGLERWGYLCSVSWSLVKPSAAPDESSLGTGEAHTGLAKDDIRERLSKLKQLFDGGLITKDEYDQKRRQLLDLL